MQTTFTEENYLKALYKISSDRGDDEVGTNELAMYLSVKPASVTEMLKRLREKKMVSYEKYGKISLTEIGRSIAIKTIRRHRLWETFLVNKLEFSWDEVHELAEELEHIPSDKLITRLDKFLGYPKYDPHGDPIPNEDGVFEQQSKKTLSEVSVGNVCKMVAVKDNTATFLQYVVSLGLGLDNNIKVLQIAEYDGLMTIEVKGVSKVVSRKFSENIYVVE